MISDAGAGGDPKKIHVDPLAPDPVVIERAAAVLRRGELVIYPTRNLYGLGADALNMVAVERLFDVKKRPRAKPVSIILPSVEMVVIYAASIPAHAKKIMDICWPGRVTLVFAASPQVPDLLCGGTGKIGIRIPKHPVARSLARALGGPITATSANISGKKGCNDPGVMDPAIIGSVGMILDAGPLEAGPGSLVIDVTVDPPRVLRDNPAVSKTLSEHGIRFELPGGNGP